MYTLKDLDIKDKKVLVRVDFNVPLDQHGLITNDKRIKASLPTINYLLDHGARQIILISHLGRPKGFPNPDLSLDPVEERLSDLLGQGVTKLDDCINVEIPEDKIILLENLRFHPQEKENDDEFAKTLAGYADLYVNDAFGAAHRSHASVDAITKYIKSAAGLLLENELRVLNDAMNNAEKPFMVVLGGAKVSDKITLINNLLPLADKILIGGAMAYTFYKALDLGVGLSKVEEDKVEEAAKLLKVAGHKLVLPSDNIVSNQFHEDADTKQVDHITDGWMGMDIGEKTIKHFTGILSEAKTILWNGPMGVFEMEPFSKGTKAIAELLAKSKATTIVGGGDSVAAIEMLGLEDKMTHISTGGGASLELFEGKQLPAITALEINQENFSDKKASLGGYISPLHEPVRR